MILLKATLIIKKRGSSLGAPQGHPNIGAEGKGLWTPERHPHDGLPREHPTEGTEWKGTQSP